MIIPPCLCWSSASVPVCFRTGWLDCCSLTLYCAYPRTSPCLGRSPLVALPDVGALLFAVGCALLFFSSFLPFSSTLRCSSRCPRTRVASFRSSRLWLVGRGSVSDFHHLLLGCGSFRNFSFSAGSLAVALPLILSRDTLWYFTASSMLRLHLQHHYSALRPS